MRPALSFHGRGGSFGRTALNTMGNSVKSRSAFIRYRARWLAKRPPYCIGFFFDDPQQHRSRPTHMALTLLPFSVTRQTHAHQGRHLRLRQRSVFSDFSGINRLVHDCRPLPFSMGHCFGQRLNQIVTECAHRLSFQAFFSWAARAATTRFSSGVMSVLTFLP